MTVTSRKYNPGFLTDDELLESFCVRTNEFDSIIEVLRECTGKSNQHQLVIGPRGSGKTSLLLRVAVEVRRDAKLSSSFFPIVFAEESYQISTVGEFWLECLSRLAVQVPNRDSEPDLRRSYEDLRTVQDDRTLGERCFGAMLDFADLAGKRLVLMVENLDMMFRNMVDPDAGWRLRKILQTEPRIVLMASAISRFDEIDNPKRALYDLFRISTLRSLSTEECAVLWESVSGRSAALAPVRPLQILTGGSPRLLAIVARFGAGRSFQELMAELLDLVDDHTEYFRSHIESLPAQERRVYLALAELWKPATTREIADRSRLDTSKCSAQLRRLSMRGVIQIVGGTARRKQYYLTERLYNIYYLLRRSRGPDPLIEALIHFMAVYYTPPELSEIGENLVREIHDFDPTMHSFHRIAFSRLIKLPALDEYRDDILAKLPTNIVDVVEQHSLLPRELSDISSLSDPDPDKHHYQHTNANERTELDAANELFDQAHECVGRRRSEDALKIYDEILHQFRNSDSPATLRLVANALNEKIAALNKLNRPEEAIIACDEMVVQFLGSDAPAIMDLLVNNIFLKGTLHLQIGQIEESLAAYELILQRFGATETQVPVATLLFAIFAKILTLFSRNRFEDALAACDEGIRYVEQLELPLLMDCVAIILTIKGTILGQLKQSEDALAAYCAAENSISDNEAKHTLYVIALLMFGKGTELEKANKLEEALAAYGDIRVRFSENVNKIAAERFATSGDKKEVGPRPTRGPTKTIAAIDSFVSVFGENHPTAVSDLVGTALVRQAMILDKLDRKSEALTCYDDVVRQFGESESPEMCSQVAIALLRKGIILEELDRLEDTLTCYEELVYRFGARNEPRLCKRVALANVSKGILLHKMNRREESLLCYDEAVRRFSVFNEPEVLEKIALVQCLKGLTLEELDREADALAVYENNAATFEENDLPGLRVWVERSLLRVAQMHLMYGRYSLAINTIERVLDQNCSKSPETLWEAHLVRAEAIIEDGNPIASELDIEALLGVLSELDSLSKERLDSLIALSLEIGSERMLGLIKASPAATLLLPLTTALKQELGHEPSVAREVEEVAKDIRNDLKTLKNMRLSDTK